MASCIHAKPSKAVRSTNTAAVPGQSISLSRWIELKTTWIHRSPCLHRSWPQPPSPQCRLKFENLMSATQTISTIDLGGLPLSFYKIVALWFALPFPFLSRYHLDNPGLNSNKHRVTLCCIEKSSKHTEVRHIHKSAHLLQKMSLWYLILKKRKW